MVNQFFSSRRTNNSDFKNGEDEQFAELRNKEIDLKREFPMTFRRSIKKSFWRAIVFLLVLVASYLFYDDTITEMPVGPQRDFWVVLLCSINFLVFCFWLSNLLYYHVERETYQYKISGGNLYLSRGLISRETGSFPLSRITDIYLHRGWGDFFWGLSSLHISTPTSSSGQFAYIHGLTMKSAEGLRERLEKLVKIHDHHIESIGGQVETLLEMQRERNKGGNEKRALVKVAGGQKLELPKET